jgi:hypothetical protein
VHATEPLQSVVARLTAPSAITAQSGFAAQLIVPPGQRDDPLVMRPVGQVMWLNDAGGQEDDKGSRLLAVDARGGIRVLADIGKLLPAVGYDIAPGGFGAYGGEVFALAQPTVAMEGALANPIVQRIDPARDYVTSVFYTLPAAGPKKVSGFGLDAHFGPPGSPFANRQFVIPIDNNAIYPVTADGQCTPCVVFDAKRYSAPAMLTFAADGQSMLVSVSEGEFDITSTRVQRGVIVSVSPAGKIADAPLFSGVARPMGMDFAPPGFGAYSGELFFADVGLWQVPVPLT